MIEVNQNGNYLGILERLKVCRNLKTGSGQFQIILTRFNENGVLSKDILLLSQIVDIDNIILSDYIGGLINSDQSVGFLSIKDSNKQANTFTYVIEIIKPAKSLIVLGAGHVGRWVAIIGSMLGLSTILIDDRKEFLIEQNIDNFSFSTLLCAFNEYSNSVDITQNTAIVIVTRGHQFDEICLRVAIQSEARYIGMIGSRRRTLAIINSLKQDDLTIEESHRLEGLHAPIGLAIGAKTPQEIAISILAQIIQVMNG
jgi:xanthine/CO dehydrogenase XdhC/CoxF family maturation factor